MGNELLRRDLDTLPHDFLLVLDPENSGIVIHILEVLIGGALVKDRNVGCAARRRSEPVLVDDHDRVGLELWVIRRAMQRMIQAGAAPMTSVQYLLEGCRFKGSFSGNDFGFRANLFDREKAGGVEDCDFSEAGLNGCRFFNCDMSTIRLPLWPCFSFMDPLGHGAELVRRE
jgi:hypothetical protein